MTACHPQCVGFAVVNAPDDALWGIVGGVVQRCDECRTFTDDTAADALRALGVSVEPTELTVEFVAPRAVKALLAMGIIADAFRFQVSK